MTGSWPAWAPAAGFVVLGTLLRLHNFWVPEPWIDEYGTWWVVSSGWSDLFSRTLDYGGQSPLYYALAKLSADLIGPGALALRLPSVVFGIGALALMGPVARRVFRDDHAALCALAAFAVDDRLIWYAQDARPYGLALFLTLLATLLYLWLMDEPSGGGVRPGYVAATTALFYVHYLFAVVVLVHLAYLTLRRRLAWLREPAWIGTYAVLGLLALPGLAHLSAIVGRRHAMSWFSQGSEAPFTLAVQMADPLVFSAVGVAVLAIGFDGPSRGVAEPGARRDFVVLWFLLPIAILAAAGRVLGIGLVYSRYALAAAPAGVLLLAWLMAAGRRTPRLRWVPLATGLAAAAIWYLIPALASVGVFGARPVEHWGLVARTIDQGGRPGDVILVQSGFVEGDLLLRGPVPPSLVSGLTWPLVANLRTHDRYQIVPLPHSAGPDTLEYVQAVAARVRDDPRVWLVGGPDAVTQAARLFLDDGRHRVSGRVTHGATVVVLVTVEKG